MVRIFKHADGGGTYYRRVQVTFIDESVDSDETMVEMHVALVAWA
jgi:hypothetical protein